ncbi:protein-glutamate O-methyltransferase CheR [Glaciecola sp. SC05]|uniref:CheR family methyltransferase n=1 Tax=Glaciecola sp. SC05 TaxID=1987355 RepID=UPI003526EC84
MSPAARSEVTPNKYLQFSTFLAERLGITLGDNKQYLVNSRLSLVMREFNAVDINTFIDDAISGQNLTLTERALDSMTTNETFWFRDEYPYQILTNELLGKIANHRKTLRIWSSACSYGQEPYSIAMTVLEYQRQHPGAFSQGVEIMATDISQRVLSFAEKGIYDQLAIARGLPVDMQAKYFSVVDTSKLSVKPALRALVKFKQTNLMDSFYAMGNFDVIFCRNVLIYFDNVNKAKILQKLSALLPAHGAILLGAAESIAGAEDTLKMEKCSRGLYYSKRS